jgi:glycine/D-amino acid oxidase-like deaminating enzyme
MSTTGLPAEARVVIIGGGVIGCSIAYYLTKLGWRDVLLLERKQLTCGTTWHAAGLLTTLRDTVTQTKLAKYTLELYRRLEAETAQATGVIPCGSIQLAITKAAKAYFDVEAARPLEPASAPIPRPHGSLASHVRICLPIASNRMRRDADS